VPSYSAPVPRVAGGAGRGSPGIIVVVLFGLFVVADRITVGVAESAVAKRIQDQSRSRAAESSPTSPSTAFRS